MRLTVTIKPRSREEKVVPAEGGFILHVLEPPVENRANEAMIRLLSSHLGIPKSRISIVAGLKSRRKIVEITPS
jgi:uncharacterized protein YggU (UPF0235/DUF167 family)